VIVEFLDELTAGRQLHERHDVAAPWAERSATLVQGARPDRHVRTQVHVLGILFDRIDVGRERSLTEMPDAPATPETLRTAGRLQPVSELDVLDPANRNVTESAGRDVAVSIDGQERTDGRPIGRRDRMCIVRRRRPVALAPFLARELPTFQRPR
jgi:hypothetical protein